VFRDRSAVIRVVTLMEHDSVGEDEARRGGAP
jgi:hypothetical protein